MHQSIKDCRHHHLIAGGEAFCEGVHLVPFLHRAVRADLHTSLLIVAGADYYDVICEDGRIVLTPVHPGAAAAVRSRLAELGISENDVADAVRWVRQE